MKTSRGETLAETLAAVFIVVMSVLILVTFITAGTKIVKTAEKRDAQAQAEMREIASFLSGELAPNGAGELVVEDGEDSYEIIHVDIYVSSGGSRSAFRPR